MIFTLEQIWIDFSKKKKMGEERGGNDARKEKGKREGR